MSDRDSFGSFLSGFIIGGLTGAIVSLLFAPQSGEETRQQIKEKSIELYDQAAVYVDDVVAKAEKTVDDVSTKAEDVIKTTKKRAAEIVEKGQVMLEGKEEEEKEKPAPAKKTAKK